MSKSAVNFDNFDAHCIAFHRLMEKLTTEELHLLTQLFGKSSYFLQDDICNPDGKKLFIEHLWSQLRNLRTESERLLVILSAADTLKRNL